MYFVEKKMRHSNQVEYLILFRRASMPLKAKTRFIQGHENLTDLSLISGIVPAAYFKFIRINHLLWSDITYPIIQFKNLRCKMILLKILFQKNTWYKNTF